MKTLKSPIKLYMILLCLLVLLFKCSSIDYRTGSVEVIDSRHIIHADSNKTNFEAHYANPQNWESTVKIIGGSHFDKGLLLKVDEKLNVDDTLFVQYNHFYDVTWISYGHGHEE